MMNVSGGGFFNVGTASDGTVVEQFIPHSEMAGGGAGLGDTSGVFVDSAGNTMFNAAGEPLVTASSTAGETAIATESTALAAAEPTALATTSSGLTATTVPTAVGVAGVVVIAAELGGIAYTAYKIHELGKSYKADAAASSDELDKYDADLRYMEKLRNRQDGDN